MTDAFLELYLEISKLESLLRVMQLAAYETVERPNTPGVPSPEEWPGLFDIVISRLNVIKMYAEDVEVEATQKEHSHEDKKSG